ncbi:MAG: NADAR family protein [Pseudomonadota bacterium]
MTIYFYTKNDEYGAFSNFSPHGIEMQGVWWPAVEHYFQAQKFDSETYRDKIRIAHSAKVAAELGRSRALPIRSDWEDAKKFAVMLKAVEVKFTTHTALAELLLSTGTEDIVENAPGDYYWGSGKDGTGQNRLGEILVRVRRKIARSSR